MDVGIDYSLGDGTNMNTKTGIHFGVINLNALSEWAIESFEADYGEPSCPNCGGDVVDYSEIEEDQDFTGYHEHSCSDYACNDCKLILGSDEVTGEGPICWVMKEDGYVATMGEDNDIFVLESPYFTHAQFCSPCAPGAGHLKNPHPDGPRTYCLGKNFFQNEKCPYPIYSVATGELVCGLHSSD